MIQLQHQILMKNDAFLIIFDNYRDAWMSRRQSALQSQQNAERLRELDLASCDAK